MITGDSDDVENTITSDPIPLRGRDRVAAILVIHYMYGGSGQEISYYTQVSNDGTNWVDDGISYWTDVLPTIPEQFVADVHGEWIRFVMWFKAKGAVPPSGATALSLRVELSRA